MTGLVMRWPLVVVALATVIGLAVADRADDGSAPERVLVSQEAASTAPGPEAKGGVWYCSEGTSLPGEFADHSVIVANPTAEAVTAAVSVFPATPVGSVSPSASPEEVLLNVPARSQAFLRLADVVESQYTAALVEIDSGSAVVEQRVQGPTGIDVMPCATRSSADWHFAAGSTRRDARLIFTLFNPFPDRAVVKFAFSTDEGLREPQALRGVLVPARSLVVVNATDLVPDSHRFPPPSSPGRADCGRKLQLFDGTGRNWKPDRRTGGPGPRRNGPFPPGQLMRLWASTSCCTTPQTGRPPLTSAPLGRPRPRRRTGAIRGVGPPRSEWPLCCGRRGLTRSPRSLAYNTASTLPAGVGFWASVQVYNGVPIVAERVAAASAAASPAGVAITAGVPVTAERYLIAGNRADESEVALAIVNPSPDSIARVTVSKLANGRITPIDQLDPREVAPHSRLVVPIDRLTDGDSYALLVEASQPVVVSRSLLARSGTGMASGASVPFDPMLLDPWAF